MLGVVVLYHHPQNGRKLKNKRMVVQAGVGKKQDLISKINRAKKGWRHD
jgi:hypothetical protein